MFFIDYHPYCGRNSNSGYILGYGALVFYSNKNLYLRKFSVISVRVFISWICCRSVLSTGVIKSEKTRVRIPVIKALAGFILKLQKDILVPIPLLMPWKNARFYIQNEHSNLITIIAYYHNKDLYLF